MTTVDALKRLYISLGGNEDDVAELNLNPEVVEALSELSIGGGATKTYYFDSQGNHGTGIVIDPFILYEDTEFTKAAMQPPADRWADIEVSTVPDGLADVSKGKPSFVTFDATGETIKMLTFAALGIDDNITGISFAFGAGPK